MKFLKKKRFFLLGFFLLISFSVEAYTWKKILEARRWGGSFTPLTIVGTVNIDNEPAVLNRPYKNRATVGVAVLSSMYIRMQDGSVFLLKGGLFEFEMGLKLSTLIKLEFGEISGVKSSLSPHLYMIQGVNGSFGLREGVFFEYKAFEERDEFYFNPQGEALPRPANLFDHICIIKGTVDFTSKGFERVEKIERTPRIKCEYVNYQNGFYSYAPGFPGYIRLNEINDTISQLPPDDFNLEGWDLEELLAYDAGVSDDQSTDTSPAEDQNAEVSKEEEPEPGQDASIDNANPTPSTLPENSNLISEENSTDT